MRLQGSQTRLGGDISRVKRESAGDGRKRKSVGREATAQRNARTCTRAYAALEWWRRRRRADQGRQAQSLTLAGPESTSALHVPAPCSIVRMRQGARGQGASVRGGDDGADDRGVCPAACSMLAGAALRVARGVACVARSLRGSLTTHSPPLLSIPAACTWAFRA